MNMKHILRGARIIALLLSAEAVYAGAAMEQLGVITDRDASGVIAAGTPARPEVICLTPQEGDEKGCAPYREYDSGCRSNTVAWDKSSCFVTEKNDLIGEISIVKPDQALTSGIYRNFSTRQIAETLVFRRFTYWDKYGGSHGSKTGYDLYHKTSLMMGIRPEIFHLILNNGFLNQHQTGTSSGKYDPGRRETVEDNLIGISLSRDLAEEDIAKANSLRPKYAYLLFDEIGDKSMPTHQYGSVFIRFKDAVKKRATFSDGDSYDLFNEGTLNFRVHTFYYQQEISSFDTALSYYEAQIWGELTADDIDYILIGCFNGIPTGEETVIQALQDKRKSVPVYSCQSVMGDAGWLRFAPKTLLYPKPAGHNGQGAPRF